MDPLSVLGAAAASSQLLEQGAKVTKFLWDLYSKMKDSPEQIRRQIIQIEQLLSLSRLFLENPALQKDSVASILGFMFVASPGIPSIPGESVSQGFRWSI